MWRYAMNYRKDRYGKELSVLGYGCMRFPRKYGKIDMEIAERLLCRAVEQGITGGVAEGKFGPDQTCTRAQIATFLYAAEKKPAVSGNSPFDDVADTDWFAKPVIWAVENKVTSGIGEGKFGPNNDCTRAAIVTFLKAAK